MAVGQSIPRVDAFAKVTGEAKYTGDLVPRGAYTAKIVRAPVANGLVRGFDLSEAQAVPGVVRIFTCFDVPDIQFPTAGHPWSTVPSHQDICDRKLLNAHIRVWGDEIAVVVARDRISAERAARLVKADIEVLPALSTPDEAMAPGAPCLHEKKPGNVIVHSQFHLGSDRGDSDPLRGDSHRRRGQSTVRLAGQSGFHASSSYDGAARPFTAVL